MRRTRALAFDLDGTLADTAADIVDVAQQICRECGFGEVPRERLRNKISNGARAIVADASGRPSDDPLVLWAADRLLKRYAARPAHLTRFFDGIAPAIRRANLPWCVITNKLEPLAHLVMHGLEPLPPGFCGTVGAGSTWHSKPSGQPLRLASRLLGVAEPDIVVIGDDRRDIQCAHAEGARGAAAAWGYIHADDDPAEWDADWILMNPGELDKVWR